MESDKPLCFVRITIHYDAFVSYFLVDGLRKFNQALGY